MLLLKLMARNLPSKKLLLCEFKDLRFTQGFSVRLFAPLLLMLVDTFVDMKIYLVNLLLQGFCNLRLEL